MVEKRRLLIVQILVVLLALSLYSQMELTNAYAHSEPLAKTKPKDSMQKKSPIKIKIRY